MRMNPIIGSSFSLSPDGHILAAATLIDKNLHLNVWRDGAVAGHVVLPFAGPRPVPMVKALDGGRVFCWFASAAVAVEGEQIIARGKFPAKALMAPDGSAIAAPTPNGFDYAAVRVDGGAIKLEHRYSSSSSLGLFAVTDGFMMDSAMFAGGIVLADNGAVYGPSGVIRPGGEWRHLGMAPGGRHTLQFTGQQVRVFSPAGGEAWTVAVPNRNLGGDATADGRHALAYLEVSPPAGMMDFIRKYPAAERLLGGIVTDYQVLYRQPGKRVAILRPRLNAWWPDTEIDNRWWFPSPDGRSVAMTASAVEGARCFLLRY